LGLVKAFIFAVPGLFRPTSWGPCTKRDLQEVAIKSAALAAENLVLALSAQGYSTCMMEGFDEVRVKNLLGLGLAGIGGSARIVMVVGVGLEGERATWGPQYRIPQSEVVHEI
jgi:nitroreductase